MDGWRSQMLPPKLRPSTRNAYVRARVRVCAYIEMDVYVCTYIYIYISEAVAASAAHSMRRFARYHRQQNNIGTEPARGTAIYLSTYLSKYRNISISISISVDIHTYMYLSIYT